MTDGLTILEDFIRNVGRTAPGHPYHPAHTYWVVHTDIVHLMVLVGTFGEVSLEWSLHPHGYQFHPRKSSLNFISAIINGK